MRVGIIGGGITGLALLHACRREGLDARLFERAERAGGIIRTRRFDDRIYEVGPQRTRLVPPVRRLVAELGLDDRVVTAREGAGLFIWARGRLRRVPTRPSRIATSDLLTLRGRARLLGEPLTGALRGDESVADYFTRKTGPEAYEALFGPLVSATFASDPSRMPARRSLPMMLDPLGVRRSLLRAAVRRRGPHAPACTFAGGMQGLTDALASMHEDRIALSAGVVSLERRGSACGIGLADGRDAEFDHVVLTVPAGRAADLLETLGEPGTGAADRLGSLTYNEVAIVSLAAEPGEGFGFQTALDSPWRTRGVTWAGWLFRRGAVCTAYLGGGLDPRMSDETPHTVRAIAEREFEQIHGRDAEALDVTRATLPAFDRSWAAMDGLAPPPGITLAGSYTGRLGIAGRVAQADAVAAELASRV